MIVYITITVYIGGWLVKLERKDEKSGNKYNEHYVFTDNDKMLDFLKNQWKYSKI